MNKIVRDAATFVQLRCRCGKNVAVDGNPVVCQCGEELGRLSGGVVTVGQATPYWGEIPQEQMRELLDESKRVGYRNAVQSNVDPSLHDYILSPDRAAFQQVMPVSEGGVFLDLGAGLGGISAELAKKFRVVALEGVEERANFIALRKEQDSLGNLTVINGNVNDLRLAPGQFDGIVVNGLLEWVGLFDTTLPVEEVQQRFLAQLRSLLKPGGMIYVGIENRLGWPYLTGRLDHSGLKYTSLMPRWLATWVCKGSGQYRSSHNQSYRTYTYSHPGYERLFRRAGLRIRSTHVSPRGYNLATNLVPFERNAIIHYTRHHWQARFSTAKHRSRNWMKMFLAEVWFWKYFGSDFVFILEARSE
jgi:SAM-dependent methyltransferase